MRVEGTFVLIRSDGPPARRQRGVIAKMTECKQRFVVYIHPEDRRAPVLDFVNCLPEDIIKVLTLKEAQ